MLEKVNPKGTRPGYERGFVDGYNSAVDDLEEEKFPRKEPIITPLPRPNLKLKEK